MYDIISFIGLMWQKRVGLNVGEKKNHMCLMQTCKILPTVSPNYKLTHPSVSGFNGGGGDTKLENRTKNVKALRLCHIFGYGESMWKIEV